MKGQRNLGASAPPNFLFFALSLSLSLSKERAMDEETKALSPISIVVVLEQGNEREQRDLSHVLFLAHELKMV